MSSDQIKFSFVPGEVITAGTLIEVTASRAVEPSSAQGAVTIRHWGEQLNYTVTIRDNKVIQIPTKDFKSGGYDLHVGELLDTSQNRLAKSIVVPLVIRASNGQVSKKFRVEHSTFVDLHDTSVSPVDPGSAPLPGVRRVEFIKGVHKETGQPIDIAFDYEGNQVDRSKVLQEVWDRRSAKYGVIHKTLWEKLEREPTKNVDVVIWPKMKRDVPCEEKILNVSGWLTDALRSFLTEIGSMKAAIVSRLKELDADIHDDATCTEPSDVYVRATLAAPSIHSLARSAHVGVIFLDNRAGISDLKDSMAIARSDLVHTNSEHQGGGVKAAVFEEGPKDTSNLVFAGRYLNDPKESKHARLTSAIVKNVEADKPHGHAPACDLYSANSYDNAALRWALSRGCTVISQSFHRFEEQTHADLQADDLLKDWLVKQRPYPTILQAAGNFWKNDGSGMVPPETEYVNHKGYNTMSIGNHNDTADAVDGGSVFRNPASPHGDRELPEMCANGTGVSAVGLTKSGTSFAAPAVAGVAALIQSVHSTLKFWPESCRAILLASSNSKITGSSWWAIVGSLRQDIKTGAGSLDAEAAVRIAQKNIQRDSDAIHSGWAYEQLKSSDFDSTTKRAKFKYNVEIPQGSYVDSDRVVVKIAIAWSSKVGNANGQYTSSLSANLDLLVWDENDEQVASSASFDNSYEVAEFTAKPNVKYKIVIRAWSWTDSGSVWCGLAWTTRKTSWVVDQPGSSGVTSASYTERFLQGGYETNNDWTTVAAGGKNSAVISFGDGKLFDYSLVTSLTMLDMGNSSGNDWALRIKAHADNITCSQFTIHADSWADTLLYGARVSWLKIPKSKTDIQCGLFDTLTVRSWDKPGNVVKTIQFATAFDRTPTVFVGLTGFDISDNWRIHVYVDGVTKTSFKIHVDTSGSSKLYAAWVSWVAFAADRQDMITGELAGSTSLGWSGTKGFKDTFDKIPIVFTAITKFDIDHFKNMRVRVSTTPKTDSMSWKIEKWADTNLYEVRASYLAIQV